MYPNFITMLLAALVPLFVGFIYYHPKTFGNVWMRVAGVTEEKMKSSNMAGIFILTYVLSFLLTFALQTIVTHQYHIFSLVAGGTQEDIADAMSFMQRHGSQYLTFKHGVFHSVIAAIALALPIIGINALFERRGGKYIWIHFGFWLISLALMGGIIGQWGWTMAS